MTESERHLEKLTKYCCDVLVAIEQTKRCGRNGEKLHQRRWLEDTLLPTLHLLSEFDEGLIREFVDGVKDECPNHG